MKPAGDSHYFFFLHLILKGAKAQVLCLQLLTWAPSEGRVAWTAVLQGECSVGGTGEPLRREAVGLSVPRYVWILQQPSCLRRASPFQGESNYFSLWGVTHPTQLLQFYSLYPLSFSLFLLCGLFKFLFCFVGFFPFILSSHPAS